MSQQEYETFNTAGSNCCLCHLTRLASGIMPSGAIYLILQAAKTYQQHCLPRRIERLRQLIQQHTPPLVVFYGFTYRAWYEQVAGCKDSLDANGAGWARQDGSLFVMIKHPTAHGVSSAYFVRIGSKIRGKIAGNR